MADITIEDILGEPIEPTEALQDQSIDDILNEPFPDGEEDDVDSILNRIPVPEQIKRPARIPMAAPKDDTEESFESFVTSMVRNTVNYYVDSYKEGGENLLRGADILFSPISGAAQAAKAKIHGVDAGKAFQNRILQALTLDEFIEYESGGAIKATQDVEAQVQDRIRIGELTPEDAYSNEQIAFSAMVDVIEAFVPLGSVKKATGVKAALEAGDDKVVTILKSVKKENAAKVLRQTKKWADSGKRVIAEAAKHNAGPKEKISILERLAVSGEANLKKLGKDGEELAKMIRTVEETAKIKTGSLVEDLRRNLDGLTKVEKKNFMQVLDGQAAPMNKKVAERAANERARLDAIYAEAEKTLGEGNLPGKRENFFPHIFDMNLFNNSKFKNKAIDKLMESGQAQSRAQAERMLAQFKKEAQGRRYGNLEKSRLENVDGWIEDPERALSIYYSRAANRIQEAKHFGRRDEFAQDLIDAIDDAGGDAGFAQRLFNTYIGKNQADEDVRRLSRFFRGAQVISKMGFSQITNAPQGFVNTALKTNISTATKAFLQSFTKKGREFANRSGATLESMLDEVDILAAEGGRLPEKFLKATGFTRLETKNRVVAALGGKMRAQWAFDKIKAGGKGADRGRRVLEDLGVDVKKAVERGHLDQDDLFQAGLRFSNTTQFTTNVLDMPEFFKSEWGKVLFQFKSFAFNHTKLMKNVVRDDIKDIAAGNYEALPNMIAKLGVTVGVGELATDIKKTIKGQSVADREASLGRLVENFSAVGGLGILTDAMRSAQYGEKGLTSFALGPTITDFLKTGGRVLGPLAKDFDVEESADAAVEEGIRLTPFAKIIKENLID